MRAPWPPSVMNASAKPNLPRRGDISDSKEDRYILAPPSWRIKAAALPTTPRGQQSHKRAVLTKSIRASAAPPRRLLERLCATLRARRAGRRGFEECQCAAGARAQLAREQR